MVEQLVKDLAIEEDLQIKLKYTQAHNNKSYVRWCAISDEEINLKKVKLTVTYDMGWQERSSGRRYESSSRHALIISGISKGVIGMLLYSKACWKCDSMDKREEEEN